MGASVCGIQEILMLIERRLFTEDDERRNFCRNVLQREQYDATSSAVDAYVGISNWKWEGDDDYQL